MKASEIKRKINAAESRLARLRPWVETLEAARRNMVRNMDPQATGHDAAKAREQLHTVDHGPQGDFLSVGRSPELVAGFQERLPGLLAARDEIAALEEQVELLRDDLPSDEELREGRQVAEQHVQAMRKAESEYARAWERLLGALEAAEAEAHGVVAAKASVLREGSNLKKVDEQFALELPETPAGHWRGPEARGQEELAHRILSVLAPAVRGGTEISPTLLSALQQARERLEPEAA